MLGKANFDVMQNVEVMDSTKIPKPPDTNEVLVSKYSMKLKVDEEKNEAEGEHHWRGKKENGDTLNSKEAVEEEVVVCYYR